ncbi:MAG TPA: hypothetical protein VFJ57_07240 [Solirubrobacterales bacterium]|nr:hypothetical protein [Solirubrobacterales bacterium]
MRRLPRIAVDISALRDARDFRLPAGAVGVDLELEAEKVEAAELG